MTVATTPLDGTFVADPVHSLFQFAIRHMKVATYRATFAGATASLVADHQGAHLIGSVRADAISITTPAEFREMVVNGEDFLDATNHPEISFSSSEARLDEDGTATLTGPLTLKGVPVTVTATGTWQPPIEDPFGGVRAAIELTAVVDRRHWGLDWQAPLPAGGDVLGWEVTLTTQLELVKEDPA